MRSFAAIRKEAGLFCGSFLRKGEVFANVGTKGFGVRSERSSFLMVGRNRNLKDQKEREQDFPVTCNPTRAVTLPNIGVPLYIGVPHRVTYPYLHWMLLEGFGCDT